MESYPVLLLFNIVLFSFLQDATSQSVQSVVAQEGIVRKTQFPRLVIPMATVMTALFNLAVNMVAVVIFLVAYGVEPMLSWLWFPFILGALFILTAALSVLLSGPLRALSRRGDHWGVAVTALFYGSPILYPFEFVPQQYRDLFAINPLTPLFIEARHVIIDPEAPGAVEAVGGWAHMIPPLAIAVADLRDRGLVLQPRGAADCGGAVSAGSGRGGTAASATQGAGLRNTRPASSLTRAPASPKPK